MSLELTILGFLSCREQSGYDLKKNFTASDFIPWSGNNNQIYKTLLSLDKEGLVDTKLDQGSNGPVRKIYSINKKGLTALKTSLLASPVDELVKNTFLVQLAFSEILETRHILELLKEYKGILEKKEIMLSELAKRQKLQSFRSEREAYILGSIGSRKIKLVNQEILWLNGVISELEEKYE